MWAAHSCYLIAQCPLDAPSRGARFVLVGADHRRFSDSYLRDMPSLNRTEVVEYAMQLQNSQHTLKGFQPYKLMYAMALADYGLTDKCVVGVGVATALWRPHLALCRCPRGAQGLQVCCRHSKGGRPPIWSRSVAMEPSICPAAVDVRGPSEQRQRQVGCCVCRRLAVRRWQGRHRWPVWHGQVVRTGTGTSTGTSSCACCRPIQRPQRVRRA